ncbi:MAG: ABC-F family ATP-binding cassette domain-containing protein [Pseudomonadota bacterium]
MLHINDLTFRIEGRLLFDKATAGIPAGHKVGLVGRNGTGKTTLLKLIAGDLAPEDGSVSWPKTTRLGYVTQEAPGGEMSLIDWVLSTDTERAALLAEAETATDPTRIADIQYRLTDIDAHTAPSRAAQVLAGLGFDEDAQRRPCRAFSGGWRMRVALASVLFREPELLLLDEPTNYLDLEGTLWLESYLASYPHTVVIVSHDRDLLNRAVRSILHLDRGKLTLYQGGYDVFEETRRERQRLEFKLMKKQDDERRRIQAFVDRFRAQANKATQAQSRLKALAKMQPIAAAIENDVADISFPQPQKQIASPLMRLEDAAVGYDTQPILQDLNLRIDADDRIALLGPNGNGKSTFAKLISGRLNAQAGNLFGAKKVNVGYFAQHQLDELSPSETPYDVAVRLMPDATEAQRRARLGAHGFGVEKADTKAANLSGGEKARLLLMITAFDGPNVLILDEPTNHLDVDSREALVRGLNAFEGAVIVISHDRHLLEATVDRLWLVGDGTVAPFEGDLDDYQRHLLDQRGSKRKRTEPSAPGSGDAAARGDRTAERKAAAERRAQLAPLKKAAATAEANVATVTGKLAQIDRQLGDGSVFTDDPVKAQKLTMLRGKLAKDLEAAEEAWLDTLGQLEAATAEAAHP